MYGNKTVVTVNYYCSDFLREAVKVCGKEQRGTQQLRFKDGK